MMDVWLLLGGVLLGVLLAWFVFVARQKVKGIAQEQKQARLQTVSSAQKHGPSSVPMIFTDGVESIGGVKRIFLHLIFCDNEGCEWQYFGTDPQDKPPPAGWDQWPIVENLYIQLPNDLDDLPKEEGDRLLYDMARLIAGRKSGWELPQ